MIERGEPGVEEAGGHAALDLAHERRAIAGVVVAAGRRRAGDVAEERVELEPRGGDAVGGIALDEGGRSEHEGPLDLRRRDAVEDGAERLADKPVRRHVRREILDAAGDARSEPRRVERLRRARPRPHGQPPEPGSLGHFGASRVALALAIGAVEDVGLGDLVEPLADQRLLDQVLHLLDGRDDVGEARLDLGDHVGRDRVDARAVDRHPDGADGLGDGGVDAAAVEGSDVPGAFDDAQHGHERSPEGPGSPNIWGGAPAGQLHLVPQPKTAGLGGW